jgi:hypothetical protein
MKVVEAFKGVRQLLADNHSWTKHTSARDSRGNRCKPEDSTAVCWCMSGALNKVVGYNAAGADPMAYNKAGKVYWAAHSLFNNINGESMVTFNDTRNHAEVLGALDKVIAAFESNEYVEG